MCTCAVSRSENCTADTFVMSAMSGRQPGAKNRSAATTSKPDSTSSNLLVRFVARSCEAFQATFAFDGLLEEKRCYLRVCGRGSYDGHHEAVVNA